MPGTKASPATTSRPAYEPRPDTWNRRRRRLGQLDPDMCPVPAPGRELILHVDASVVGVVGTAMGALGAVVAGWVSSPPAGKDPYPTDS